jgi:diacylglycerol kinase (ATP)
VIVTVILNGSKKNAKKTELELLRLDIHNIDFRFFYTTHKGHAAELAHSASQFSQVIISVGGDGTIHECVNGIMKWHFENPEKKYPSLLPLALGTGNDFVRNLPHSSNINSIVSRINNPSPILADVGRIQYTNGLQVFFINECSAGIGPSVVQCSDSLPKLWSGNLRFGLAILKTFLTYKKKQIEIFNENIKWCGLSICTVIANGKFFGSGICIAPDARIDDGVLHITVIGDVSIIEYLRYLPALRRGKKINHPQVFYFEAQELTIKSEGLTETDGEIGHEAYAHISIIKSAIELL